MDSSISATKRALSDVEKLLKLDPSNTELLSQKQRMLKEAVSANPNGAGTIYFCHADCSPEEVEMVKNMLEEQIHPERIALGYIGPIIGASIGPDAVAIFGFGKEITFAV